MAGRGKIGGKKTEKHKFIFSNFFFWRAGRRKIGGKKLKKIGFIFFFKLIFFGGWSLENRWQKTTEKK